MEVHFKPETESQLNELATRSGRATDELVEDALAGYLGEVTQTREMLDSRYDHVKTGRVTPMDGDEALARLRQKSTDRHSTRS
jgi:predicted transcriptional regulator